MSVISVFHQNRTPYRPPDKPEARTRGQLRLLAISAMAVVGLLNSPHETRADTRLEAQRFGNIDQQQLRKDFPALDALLEDAHVTPGLHENFVPGPSGTEGWTAGYRIDPETLRPTSQMQYDVSYGGVPYKVYRPNAAFRHGNNVQGMSFIDKHHVVLSTSYGARRSALTFHELPHPPLDGVPIGRETVLPDGSVLQVHTLAEPTRTDLIPAPPGAEGVAYNDRKLIVAFEGGALPYRNRWRRIEDRMLLLRPPENL